MLSLVVLLAVAPLQYNTSLAFVSQNLAKGNGNWFTYYRFANNRVRFDTGDVLEYRIFLAPSNPVAKGGIDVQFDGGGTPLRDVGIMDDKGVRIHGDGVLTEAIGKWLTRKISLDRVAGRTSSAWNLVFEGDPDGQYAQFIDDVVVRKRDGTVVTIYKDGPAPARAMDSANGYTTEPSLVSVETSRITTAGMDALINDVLAVGARLRKLDEARRTVDLAKQFAETSSDPHMKEHAAEAEEILKAIEMRNATAQEIEDALHKVRNVLEHTHPMMEQFTGHLVGHAHIDLQWLWEWQEGIVAAERTFEQAVKFMDEYPGFTFSQSSSCLYQTIEENYPALFEKIKKKVASGQWELVGGRVCEGDLNLISHESHARHFLYGQRYFREKFGKTAAVGWEPDTFGHNIQMPQILKQGGCDYYYFCRAGKGKPLFWWQGLDGTKVLAFEEPATGSWYNSDLSYKQFQEMVDFQTTGNSKDSLWVYGVGNHGGGPTREMIEWALAQMKDPTKPTIKFSTATEFFKKLETYDLTKIPVINDELNPIFDGCYTTHSRVKELNRDAEATTTSTEAVAAVAHLFGFEYPTATFRKSWEDITFNHHHDTLPGSGIHSPYLKTYAVLERVIAQNKDIAMRAMETLSLRVTPKEGGISIIAFNPLGWTRGGWVETYLVKSGWDGGQSLNLDQVVAESPDGTVYPVTTIERHSRRIRFWAGSVPAFGYAVYHLRAARPNEIRQTNLRVTEEGSVIDSQFQTVRFNKKGGFISSLNSKDLNIESAKALGRLEIHWERPAGMSAWVLGRIDRIQPLEPFYAETSAGSDYVDVIFKYRVPAWNNVSGESIITQRFRVMDYRDIEVEITCDWKGVGTNQQPNALLRVAFETPFANAKSTYAVPFGAMVRANDNREMPALQWAHIAEGDAGLAIFNDAKHGFSNDGSTIRMSLIRSSYDPDPVPDVGHHVWRYSITATGSDWDDFMVPRRATEFNQPLLSATVPFDAHGDAPLRYSAVDFDQIGPGGRVLPTTLKMAEDGGAFVVRMFESAGKAFQGNMKFGFQPKSAEEVNFIEDRIAPARIFTEGVRFPLKPWEIKSFKIGLPERKKY
jgi:alpha-mannosidase